MRVGRLGESYLTFQARTSYIRAQDVFERYDMRGRIHPFGIDFGQFVDMIKHR